MREASRYIYRGKTLSGKTWVYGCYYKYLPYTPNPLNYNPEKHKSRYKHVIITEGSSDWGLPRELRTIDVRPNTVCQCTGLTDKRDNPVYESDIVRYKEHFYVVTWDGDAGKFILTLVCDIPEPLEEEMPTNTKELVVVGNIIDNIDLLLELIAD